MDKQQFKYKIRLDTMSSIQNFVNIMQTLEGKFLLTDGEYNVSPKSFLGCLAALEWNNLILVSDKDIYWHIRDYIVTETPETDNYTR